MPTFAVLRTILSSNARPHITSNEYKVHPLQCLLYRDSETNSKMHVRKHLPRQMCFFHVGQYSMCYG